MTVPRRSSSWSTRSFLEAGVSAACWIRIRFRRRSSRPRLISDSVFPNTRAASHAETPMAKFTRYASRGRSIPRDASPRFSFGSTIKPKRRCSPSLCRPRTSERRWWRIRPDAAAVRSHGPPSACACGSQALCRACVDRRSCLRSRSPCRPSRKGRARRRSWRSWPIRSWTTRMVW